jgi:molybdenum cofactor biosynthesis protein B
MSVKEHKKSAPRSVACAVLTVSDTRTADTDESGALIRALLERAGHRVTMSHIVPDDGERIVSLVRMMSTDAANDAIIVTGGTGLAPRDTTYEAVSRLFTRRIDGFGELFRFLSFQEIGAAAMLSRAVAGLIGTTVVFALPGSTSGVRLGLEKLILPELSHAVSLASPTRRGS